MAAGPLVGITGRARSGKDTFAEFLRSYLGGTTYSFAHPIRQMLRGIGVNMEDPYWQTHKEDPIPAIGKSPRELMQTLGTEWGRELIHPHLWIILAHRFRMNDPSSPLIISDVRFDNEANWIRNSGGVVIRVVRNSLPPVNEHVSENGTTPAPSDIIVQNNGTLEDLQIAAREVFYAIEETRNNVHPTDP